MNSMIPTPDRFFHLRIVVMVTLAAVYLGACHWPRLFLLWSAAGYLWRPVNLRRCSHTGGLGRARHVLRLGQ